MKLFVLAIATLAVLQGYVEPKNTTGAITPTTPKQIPSLLTSTTTTATKAHRRTPTRATASTKKASSSDTPAVPAGSDREARGKRTLELGNYNGNYNYYQTVPAHTAQRRVSHAYQDPGQYSSFQSNYIQPQFSFGPAQSGAVGGSLGSYQGFEPQLDGTNTIGSFQSLPPQIHTRYIEPPEPIIEIIIKESNDSLPLDTQSLFPKQKKKKEEVQVFYVKYHKDEKNGQLVLDDPLPAIKPIPDESEEEEDPSQEPIVVTPSPPLKTTTLRAIINPDSEKYHSNSGIRISFGVEDKHQSGHQLSETESESVAQPVVALPQPAPAHRAKSDVFFQQHQQFVQQQQDRSVRQQYPQQPQQPHQHYNVPPQPHHHYQPQQQQQVQYHQQQPHHHQQHLPQAQPLVQQPHQHFSPASPPPFRPQPQAQPQPQPQQQHQHFQQHQYQQQPQPQPQRVIYSQPQPQPQFHYRGQFQQQAQPQQQPQQQYYTHQAPIPQPRPLPQPQPQPQQQQVRFPPPQHQQPQPQPHFYQPQQQQQQPQYQQPKPIPIPLHNINQQPQLRQQYAPQPQPQQPQQQPQPQQFNQPFNNFYKQQQQPQPQPQPTPQPQFRKATPSPPAIVQQPPFAAQRPQAPSATYQQQNFETRGGAFVGGLVQQAAPNLGPTRAPQGQKPSFGLSDSEHLSNLKHVLPAGGELVPSVSKYEKHITETINGPVEGQQLQQPRQQQQQQQQASFNRQQPFYNIQPSQELISHSIAPQIETIPNKLPTPQRYVSQQAAEIIPNSEPIRQQVDPRFNFAAQQSAGAQGFDASSVSTPSTTVGTSRTTYSPTFSTTPRTTVSQYPATSPATTRQTVSTTRAPPVTAARSAAEEAEANAKKQKALFDLPDEVPDDLREQLLSSGILDNADISVLDYDKLGETDLQSLPPEHLANFFNAGGGAQLAGSSNVLSVVSPNGDKLAEKFISKNYDVKDKRDERDRYEIANGGDEQQQHQQQDENEEEEEEEPTIVTMPERQNVDLKVVRFDSNNQKNVTDRYIKQDSTILPSVDVTREADSAAGTQTEQIFNRYLPLKINGAQFPIPDVVELRGRRIASVVVLAPVDQPATQQQTSKSGEAGSGSEEGNDGAGFLINADDDEEREGTDGQQSSRFERDVLLDSKKIKFIAGEALKQLIKKPSRDNFRRWLEREGKTDVDLQSVVLLVTRNDYNEQEIFMYDIATKGVTHLSGELSAAFVQVAEENAKTQNLDEMPIVDSGIVEQMETRSSTEAVDYVTASFGSAASSSEEQDEQAEASERKAVYVYPENYRGLEVNSGYSHIKK
ncbi:bromodomain-containing protein 4 [Anopheles darlingi]|uniref:bromodomain-containing protein 4 n=1 Tax=Anopheles darlingi TaxID=43151 RepID=UPI002100574E|nr:bromodomain-containing protein 4 [Anopheles darlingi]